MMRVAGLMSGTSADGIDVAVADITDSDNGDQGEGVEVRQVLFATIPWPADTRERILATATGASSHSQGGVDLQALSDLNFELGRCFADALLQALREHDVPLASVDLVGSHGQTVHHHPPVSTLQLGEAAVIAAATGLPVVSDFRVADVAVGGQGAPLVCKFDELVLRGAGGWRALQNIGGIGNVTFVPPTADPGAAVAFDTGPGNALMDLAAAACDPALAFDRDGRLAARGRVVPELLERMLRHPYLARAPPKTTGREEFSAELFASFAAEAEGADLVATLTEFTARSIADAYAAFAPGELAEVLVSGGGARNPTLMAALQRLLAPVPVRPLEAFDPDAKEALAFALLAYLHAKRRPGNVPSCTGASREVVLGRMNRLD